MKSCVKKSTNFSKVRLVHNVANGPIVDIFVDATKIISNFAYKTISPYLQISSNTHVITVKIANTESIIVQGAITFKNKFAYTLLVHGLNLTPSSILITALEDNLSCPIPGRSHIRFFHGASSAPAVDIYLEMTRIFTNVSYNQVGTPEYVSVPSGSVDVGITASGKVDRIYGPLKVNLVNGGVYTVIASGLIGNTEAPLAILVSEDTIGSCVVMNI